MITFCVKRRFSIMEKSVFLLVGDSPQTPFRNRTAQRRSRFLPSENKSTVTQSNRFSKTVAFFMREKIYEKGERTTKKPNLERPIQMIFRVSEHERDFIFKKMKIAKTKNKAAYLRKMAMDGYILNVDFSEFKELFADVGSVSRNVNQIARRVNSTDRIYVEDVSELKLRVEEIWQLIKSLQSKLP